MCGSIYLNISIFCDFEREMLYSLYTNYIFMITLVIGFFSVYIRRSIDQLENHICLHFQLTFNSTFDTQVHSIAHPLIQIRICT